MGILPGGFIFVNLGVTLGTIQRQEYPVSRQMGTAPDFPALLSLLSVVSKGKLMAWILILAFAASPAVGGETMRVGRFSSGELHGWKERQFHGTTRYQFSQSPHGLVLKAQANGSASGLFRKIRIDLRQTPFLHWCWQVLIPLPPLPEESKSGDDYAARIYLVKKGGMAFWRTRALNYVWSSSQPRESLWPNAFAGDNVMMLAVRNGEDRGWICEKRNVRADWQRAFGEVPDRIDAVALMSDSDNSQKQTAAYYGDIWFTAD